MCEQLEGHRTGNECSSANGFDYMFGLWKPSNRSGLLVHDGCACALETNTGLQETHLLATCNATMVGEIQVFQNDEEAVPSFSSRRSCHVD